MARVNSANVKGKDMKMRIVVTCHLDKTVFFSTPVECTQDEVDEATRQLKLQIGKTDYLSLMDHIIPGEFLRKYCTIKVEAS